MKYDSDDPKGLLEDAARRGIRYREAVADRSVAPTPDAIEAVKRFMEPLPDSGKADTDTLALLDEVGSPATVAMAGPRYFGFVIGGSYPVTLATNWLTTAWDQNVVMHEVTPAAATLEQVALAWMIVDTARAASAGSIRRRRRRRSNSPSSSARGTARRSS